MDISEIMWNEVLTISMTLFAIIDIFGSIPIIMDLRQRFGNIESFKATIVSLVIMIIFMKKTMFQENQGGLLTTYGTLQ